MTDISCHMSSSHYRGSLGTLPGLEKDASKAALRNYKMSNHGTEQKNACPQQLDRSRWHGRPGAPWLSRDTSSRSPFLGGGSLDQGSEHRSHQLTWTGGCGGSYQAGRAGRGLRVKVNLPIFKDETIKDAVTCHSWQWDIAIFCHWGWNDWHFLPYVFQSLQGFPGDLARLWGRHFWSWAEKLQKE